MVLSDIAVQECTTKIVFQKATVKHLAPRSREMLFSYAACAFWFCFLCRRALFSCILWLSSKESALAKATHLEPRSGGVFVQGERKHLCLVFFLMVFLLKRDPFPGRCSRSREYPFPMIQHRIHVQGGSTLFRVRKNTVHIKQSQPHAACASLKRYPERERRSLRRHAKEGGSIRIFLVTLSGTGRG